MPSPKDPIKYQEWINKLKNRIITDETRKHMSIAKKGIHLSETHSKRISESNKGRIKSEEERRHISEGLKNKPKSEEHRKHLSEANMGKPSPRKGVKLSEETKEKIRRARKGTKSSKTTREKISKSLIGNTRTLGYIHSQETKDKMRSSAHRGPEHYNYKDGITPLNKAIRRLPEYNTWKYGVFKRDNYTCKDCGKHGGNLESHHDGKSFAQILIDNNIKTIQDALNCKELWNIDNGITLCIDCHEKRHATTERS